MKKTLLVEENSQLTNFFTINLLAWVGSHTTTTNEAKFAIEYLQKNAKTIDLIIARAKIKTEKTAHAIDQYLKDNNLEIPFIIIGECSLKDDRSIRIDSAFDIKEIIKSSAQLLKVTAQEMANLSIPDFFEIPIEQFKVLDTPACDIYKKIDLTEFELIIKRSESFNYSTLEKSMKLEAPFLYVKKNDRLNFVKNINEEIAAKVNFSSLNDDERMGAVELSQSLLQQQVARLGLTDDVIALSQRNLKHMVNTCRNEPSVKHLLKRMMKNKTEFLFKHSQMLMFVATHLLNQLDWVTKEQKDKLQFIAFWHDIALETSEQAKIHSDEELKKSKLSKEDKELVKKHAQIGATIVSQYPNAPLGAEQIIKQHHGVQNGAGFSTHYSQNISPMAIVFILAEDLVESLIHADKNFIFKVKIKQMRKRYETQRFQKIIDALETLIS